jgi:hypothetical protein
VPESTVWLLLLTGTLSASGLSSSVSIILLGATNQNVASVGTSVAPAAGNDQNSVGVGEAH